MPVTAATREMCRCISARRCRSPTSKEILAQDFARMAETMAELSGMES